MSKVDIHRQIIYSVIPIVNLLASLRIKKLRKFLLLLTVIFIGLNFLVGLFIDWPLNIIPFLIIYTLSVTYYMRKWSIQWNNQHEDNRIDCI